MSNEGNDSTEQRCVCCSTPLDSNNCNLCDLRYEYLRNGDIHAINGKDSSRLVYVPEGPFLMGGADWDTLAEEDEKPPHLHRTEAFFIGVYAITNAQMALFVNQTQYTGAIDSEHFRKRFSIHTDKASWAYPRGKEEYPAVELNFQEVNAYCRWAGLRLPCEAEWEKASRGTDGRVYPWGNTWNVDYCCNSVNDRRNGPEAVESRPDGRSPYGCFNMAGNVWEWSSDWYNPYSYDSYAQCDYRLPEVGVYRVLRGGSWCWPDADHRRFFRCSYRNHLSPLFPSYNTKDLSFGFRVARGCDRNKSHETATR